MKALNRYWIIFSLLLCCVFFCACGQGDAKTYAKPAPRTDLPPRDTTPHVLKPEAEGTETYGDAFVWLDASHTDQGYVMASYKGEAQKVKIQVKTPDEEVYTYLLDTTGDYETFPLNAGNGLYNVSIYENVMDDMYAMALTQDLDVTITDEFLPFLYPNQYVWFNDDVHAVAKAQELAADCYTDFDVVSNVYHYVITNITYDDEKAATVEYGYLPDVDETLASGKGICFDYASLMAAMLRSQDIPTRLEIGYADTIYHAWISIYIPEVGWVDNVIEFDGTSWRLMDPTFAAGNPSSDSDDTNYDAKYYY